MVRVFVRGSLQSDASQKEVSWIGGRARMSMAAGLPMSRGRKESF